MKLTARFRYLSLLFLLGLLPSVGFSETDKAVESVEDNTITVFKSPTCGCCGKWADHLMANGFNVRAINRKDMNSVKAAAGIPYQLASCHTAVVAGYTIEGHVPANDIKRLLKERPNVEGLTVPRMPMGSPGMEGPRKDPYDVLTFTRSGETTVFSKH